MKMYALNLWVCKEVTGSEESDLERDSKRVQVREIKVIKTVLTAGLIWDVSETVLHASKTLALCNQSPNHEQKG